MLLKFSFPVLLLLLCGCSLNEFSKSHKAFLAGNYMLAIQEIDMLIYDDKDSYKATLATNDRTEAYYRLGVNALERNDTALAIRLFLLANSDDGDERIIETLEKMSENGSDGNYSNILSVYNYILDNFYRSQRIPEFRYRRMALYTKLEYDKLLIWEDFKLMSLHFPESDYIESSYNIIEPFLISDVVDPLVRRVYTGGDIESAIEGLLEVRSFAKTHRDYINEKIADVYIFSAGKYIESQRYARAMANFQSALEFDLKRQASVNERMRSICDLFIQEGVTMLNNRNVDQAIEIFQRAFEIIPNYGKALEAIEQAHQKRRDIAQAATLYQQSQNELRLRNNDEALSLLRRAYRLDPIDLYQKSVDDLVMTIEIEKDPGGYALRIIREYERGRLRRSVEGLRDNLRVIWGDQLRDSDWRVGRALGQNRVEIRYDLLTPDTNYYLVWHVHLRDKQVVPLNKATEAIMGE